MLLIPSSSIWYFSSVHIPFNIFCSALCQWSKVFQKFLCLKILCYIFIKRRKKYFQFLLLGLSLITLQYWVNLPSAVCYVLCIFKISTLLVRKWTILSFASTSSPTPSNPNFFGRFFTQLCVAFSHIFVGQFFAKCSVWTLSRF